MSGLIASLGSVTGLVFGVLVGVVWLFAAPGSKWPRRWLAGLVLVYLAATVHGVARIASWPLRRGFQSFDKADAPSGPTIVLFVGSVCCALDRTYVDGAIRTTVQ